ncbi:MAG: LuxR family transcriptional regulator [Planctomycetota bacterium]|nr:MAG: LuxR family transcriptional regulator [Planctomycetota bacterium]
MELLLSVARDASLGTDYRERMEAIAATLRVLVPASALSVMVVGARGPTHAFFHNNDPANLEHYVAYYRSFDPMGHLIPQGSGEPRSLSDFCTDRNFGCDPFTGEFLPPQGIRHILGLAYRLPERRRLALAVHREASLGDFTLHERELIRLAAPDIGRAVMGCLLRERLEALSAPAGADGASGALVLDALGGVVQATPGALALCQRLANAAGFPAEPLVADAQRLVSAGRESDALVRWLPLGDGGFLRCESCLLGGGAEGRVLCILRRAGPHEAAAGHELLRAAKLTPREREVALLAVEGLSNSEIAHALRISAPTVSSHLARVYKKVGVHGRTELARRVLHGTHDDSGDAEAGGGPYPS